MINKQITVLGFAMIFLVFALSLISAISITGVTSTPSEVVPGEIVSVNMRIENIFQDDVFNLNVKLNLENVPFAPYQSSSESYLDELKNDDSEVFNFELIALPSAGTGIYKIPVEITYEDEDSNFSTKSELISIIINSVPELTISLEDVILIKGQENIIDIKIVNSGLSDVKFMYVNLNDVIGLNFLTEKNQYLGDIDSDDFDSAEYGIYISESSTGSITLPVKLTYKDSTNKEFTQIKNIILRVYSLEEAQSLGLVKKPNYTTYFVLGILVIGYFTYRSVKKRRRRKNRR
jgi:hypothetical protein